MKKAMVCLLFLVFVAAGVPAERLMFVGAGVSHGAESRETFPDFSMTSVCLHLGTFSGKALGLYSTMALGYILAGTTGGAAIDTSLYDLRISFDAVLGLGYSIPIPGPILAVVGAGLHLGMAMMVPGQTSDPEYGGTFAVGPGLQAMVCYRLTPGIAAGVSLGAGYGLWEPFPLEPQAYTGGMHVFGAAGVSFSL